MSEFTVHNLENAPEGSKPVLENLKKSVGAIPNLAGMMAGSPQLIEAFVRVREIWQKTSFTPLEREVVAATNAVTNECRYCVAIHSTFALKEGIGPSDLDLIRAGKSPVEPRLKALSDFARKIMLNRGQTSDADLEEFLSAGFTRTQALELLVGTANSVLANFSNHLTDAPLDEFLKPQAWSATA
ncbi:MAG: carboxymuconolactone decarboxylase family protein [Pyrinomonadaceae bacterium]